MEDYPQANEYADAAFTTIQLATLAGHMILANTLDTGLVVDYEVQEPVGWYLSMAIRKGGKATIAVYSEQVPQVYMMEIIADAEKMNMVRQKHIIKLPDQDMAEGCWEDIMDQLGGWSRGEIDEIIIGETIIQKKD